MTDKDTIPQVFWDNFQWATEHSTELHQQYEDVFASLTDLSAAAHLSAGRMRL